MCMLLFSIGSFFNSLNYYKNKTIRQFIPIVSHPFFLVLILKCLSAYMMPLFTLLILFPVFAMSLIFSIPF